jgi:hypothetical protein
VGVHLDPLATYGMVYLRMSGYLRVWNVQRRQLQRRQLQRRLLAHVVRAEHLPHSSAARDLQRRLPVLRWGRRGQPEFDHEPLGLTMNL